MSHLKPGRKSLAAEARKGSRASGYEIPLAPPKPGHRIGMHASRDYCPKCGAKKRMCRCAGG